MSPMSPMSPAERRRVSEVVYALGAAVVRRAPREVSLTAISTLATLERTGPRRITDLAVVQGVSQPSMTSLVSGLERAAYVERRADPRDGRVALVALTGAGEAALRSRRAASTEAVAELVDQLSDAETAALAAAVPALARLRQLDEQQREPLS